MIYGSSILSRPVRKNYWPERKIASGHTVNMLIVDATSTRPANLHGGNNLVWFKVSDCESEYHGFKSHLSPKLKITLFVNETINTIIVNINKEC